MSSRSHHLALVFSLLLSLCLGAAEESEGLAVAPPQALFVFDASQSMYGKLPGSARSKLNLAKAIMAPALKEWPREIHVGLLAYGHRGRGAPGGDRCRDIETVVPIGSSQAPQIARAVSGLSARGTTPLCAALVEAGKQLKATTTPGSIILISDGSEECGGDVEETIRALAAGSASLVVDIISLGQQAEANAPLGDLARLTGGRLFDIREETAAAEAMESIVDALTGRTNLRVTAYDRWDDEIPTSKDLRWFVYPSEPDAEGERALLGEFQGHSVALAVTPGAYWIQAHHESTIYDVSIHVPQEATAAQRLSLSHGEVEFVPERDAATQGWHFKVQASDPVNARKRLVFVSETELTDRAVVNLPAGRYHLEYQLNESKAQFMRFRVEAERRHVYDVLSPKN